MLNRLSSGLLDACQLLLGAMNDINEDTLTFKDSVLLPT